MELHDGCCWRANPSVFGGVGQAEEIIYTTVTGNQWLNIRIFSSTTGNFFSDNSHYTIELQQLN